MNFRLLILPLWFLLPLQATAQLWNETDTLQELTREQADSLFFRFSHHYSINFNFRLKADSLILIPHESDFADTCVVMKDELLVVADIRKSETDTVWVKLYRDQVTMGWVIEPELLKSAIPDDNISEIIDFFESHEVLLYCLLSVLLIVGLLMFRINRFYSFLYVILTLCLAVSVWHVIDCQQDYWREFYFHPTLNPFVLPLEMKIIVGLFWLECITSVALIFVFSDHLQDKTLHL